MTHHSKNILIAIKSLHRGGGAEKIAAGVGNGLAEKGHNVTFVTFASNRDNYDTDCEVINLQDGENESSFEALRKVFTRAKRIAEIAKEKNADTVISFMFEASFAAIMAKLFGYRSAVFVSAQVNPRNTGRKARAISRYLYPYANKVVACSRGLEAYFNDHGVENTTTIYNFFDPAEAREKSKNPLPSKYSKIFNEKTIVNVGRLVTQKGQWHLLRSFQKVQKTHPNTNLVILGEGELREKLEDLARKLGIENSVHFIGNQENVYPFLNLADVVVSSSLWEGLPLSLLEACAVNDRVISTDSQFGPREIIAPDVPVKKPLRYPYSGRAGTLVPDLASQEIRYVFDARPLLQGEVILAQAITESVNLHESGENGNFNKFEYHHILSKWENMISKSL